MESQRVWLLGSVLPKGKVVTLEPCFKGYQKVFQKKKKGAGSLEAKLIPSLQRISFQNIQATIDQHGGPLSVLINNPQTQLRLFRHSLLLDLILKTLKQFYHR